MSCVEANDIPMTPKILMKKSLFKFSYLLSIIIEVSSKRLSSMCRILTDNTDCFLESRSGNKGILSIDCII